MTKFKVGDRFTPHKPKDVNEYPLWQPCMDLLNGKTLVIENITSNGEISAECCLFHPDWCEKVEEESVFFVQREVAEIIPEYTMNTSASQHWPEVTFIQQEFPPKQEPSVPATTLEQALRVQKIPNDHIPDVGKTIDWEQRRYELAKSAMQGMTTNEYYLEICASKAEDNKTEWENILCSNAINVADEMIKQLKQQ